jgi:hypothetical protein
MIGSSTEGEQSGTRRWSTSTRGSAAAVKILAEDRELQARLRADRSLLRNFIEETLRWESPVRGGPAGDRKYRYIPTFILRGLTRLHIGYELA